MFPQSEFQNPSPHVDEFQFISTVTVEGRSKGMLANHMPIICSKTPIPLPMHISLYTETNAAWSLPWSRKAHGKALVSAVGKERGRAHWHRGGILQHIFTASHSSNMFVSMGRWMLDCYCDGKNHENDEELDLYCTHFKMGHRSLYWYVIICDNVFIRHSIQFA